MNYLDKTGLSHLWSKIKSLVSGYLPLTGGTLTGNLTGKYIVGTWFQTTATTDLGKTPPKVAVIDSSGWIYTRTPEELLSDMGGASKNKSSFSLTSSGWATSGSIYTQTVNVSGVKSTSIIIVSSAPGNSDLYGQCGVKCVSQGSGTLTFNATTKPTSDLTVNIVNLGDE